VEKFFSDLPKRKRAGKLSHSQPKTFFNRHTLPLASVALYIRNHRHLGFLSLRILHQQILELPALPGSPTRKDE
jgi:hypothetical protein